MKASLKSTLDAVINRWLAAQGGHEDRPAGLACPDLGELMADAAAAVYDASHAGSEVGREEAEANR